MIVPALAPKPTVTTAVAAAEPHELVTVYDIVVVPTARPLTTPNVFTVPVAGFVELHMPPIAASLKDVVEPVHAVAEPESEPALGAKLTVAIVITEQPAPVE